MTVSKPSAVIEEDLYTAGLRWINCLKAPTITLLTEDKGLLDVSLFDTREMVEITAPDYPGERLIVCRNTAISAERAYGGDPEGSRQDRTAVQRAPARRGCDRPQERRHALTAQDG